MFKFGFKRRKADRRVKTAEWPPPAFKDVGILVTGSDEELRNVRWVANAPRMSEYNAKTFGAGVLEIPVSFYEQMADVTPAKVREMGLTAVRFKRPDGTTHTTILAEGHPASGPSWPAPDPTTLLSGLRLGEVPLAVFQTNLLAASEFIVAQYLTGDRWYADLVSTLHEIALTGWADAYSLSLNDSWVYDSPTTPMVTFPAP